MVEKKKKKLVRQRVVLEFDILPKHLSGEAILELFTQASATHGIKLFSKEILTVDDSGDEGVRLSEIDCE